MFRVGLGYDNHRLAPELPFWIGGIRIAAPVGCEAHSDGDVLLHALTDALLGAIAGGDIGELFPDTDDRWRGAESSQFVIEAARRVVGSGYRVVNVDATVLLQDVKLSPYKGRIAARVHELIAAAGAAAPGDVSVKAKTKERCDSVGEGRAVEAHVVVLVRALEGDF